MPKSLQAQFAANSICYGCGPANPDGLQIESIVDGERVIAHWQPQPHHHAFPNVLNGGIIGSILDCHCNWAACWYLMQDANLKSPPCTVTAEYTVKLKRPTPMNTPLTLIAELAQINGHKAHVTAQLRANDKLCATCEGLFVSVNQGHPGYHRW